MRYYHYKYGPLSLIRNNENDTDNMADKISKLDRRVQSMLLWSSIFALLSYVALMFRILNLYKMMKGGHPSLLLFNLSIVCLFFCLMIFKLFNRMKVNKTVMIWPDKSYLNYQIDKLCGQRKLIIMYLALYAAMISTATAFFYLDVNTRVNVLLRIIMPVCIIMYGGGLYFIAIFTRQKRKLDELRRRVDHVYFSETLYHN